MTLFITTLELLNQECEKHDLSCLVPDLLSAQTSAGAGGNKQFLTGNGCCRETSPGPSTPQLIVRDRYGFSGLGRSCSRPLSSQTDVIHVRL